MTEHADLGAWALATLRANESVTALITDGAAGVVESGELSSKDLQDAQASRRESGETGKVLAVLVMDTGEAGRTDRVAACSVFVYDRGRGYGSIRAVREAAIDALANQPVSLTRDAFIVRVRYAGRTGHQRFEQFDLDYERVDFEGPLTFSESGDSYG